MAKITIIGAGISGLSTAFWLKQTGHEVTVLEKNAVPGGVIRTIREDGYLFETGPNTFLDNVQETMDLCHELKLHNELLKQSMRDNDRFIYYQSKLHKVSPGPGFLKSELLTKACKRKMLTEPFRRGNRSKEDESLASFIRRRFGEDLLKNLVTPFVSGVYAGDPEKLSLRATFPLLYDLERQHGSVVRGGIMRAFFKKKKDAVKKKKRRTKNLCSFVDGMDVMIRAMAEALGESLRTHCPIASVTYTPGQGYTIATEAGETRTADAVVLAVSSNQAADIAPTLLPQSAEYLRTIPYNRLSVVGLGYALEQVQREINGFGFLVPREQDIRILGSIWSSSLFPRRAPRGMYTFTVMIGGGLDPQSFDLSDAELIDLAHRDLQKAVGIAGDPVKTNLIRWERAIPQYPVGHMDHLETLEAERRSTPGFFLVGNYMDGVSTNDCIYKAKQTVEEIQAYFTA
ncbi:MAG: protoporphyrinogen oxidase [bacterium]|jgi:oxygen-dependent protoporphyrinogen oxidase|nr:protoporphyrinogen oxidase [bacterium]